jgi:hypothetical protein
VDNIKKITCPDERVVGETLYVEENELDDLAERLIRILGLTHENVYQEHTWVGDNHVSSDIELYDSKANAETHDGTTGLIAKYTLTVNYLGPRALNHLMVRDQ